MYKRQPDADIPPEKLRTALAGSGALFVDLKAEFDALYRGYMDQAVHLSLAGFLAIVVLLALTLRSRARLLRVLLALVLTVLGDIALLHLAGVRLHLLHLVGMLLIVAVGSNYALFFDRAAGGEPVSYTHLDVYKRQAVRCRATGAFWSGTTRSICRVKASNGC